MMCDDRWSACLLAIVQVMPYPRQEDGGKAMQPTTLRSGNCGPGLNIISDRLPIGGKIATWLVGAAWGIATMFAIPVIMDNKETRPLKTVRTSAITLKKVWGESAFIGIGLGLIEIVVTIVMMFILVGSVAISVVLSTWVYGAAAAAIFVLGIIAFGVVMSTLRTIIMTAAYYYASTDQLPAGFDDELIRSMFRPKRAWLK